jgi:hypothetical protein
MSDMIGDVLAEAADRLKGEKFHPEDLVDVDAAFARHGLLRPSDDIAECSAALLRIMAS